MSVSALACVALVVNDVERVAGVLEGVLGLTRRDAAAGVLLGAGRTALAILSRDDPLVAGAAGTGVHYVALAAADPAAASDAAGLSTGARRVAGIDGRHELALDARATCGVNVRLCEPCPEVPCAPCALVSGIDHVGVASAHNARATAIFAGGLGLEVESTQTDVEVSTAIETFTSDRYGVVTHSRPPRIVGGLRVSFLSAGDCELEFLAPIAPHDLAAGAATGERADPGAPPPGSGNTAGDKGAIARFIERHGAGLHHLALRTPDIGAALAALDAAGVELIDRKGRPGSRRALIGFVHPRALGGVLMHLVERDDG